jgi:hypothetical protein
MQARTKKGLVLVREIALGLAPAALIIGVTLAYIWATENGYWQRDYWWNECVASEPTNPCVMEDERIRFITPDGEEIVYEMGKR